MHSVKYTLAGTAFLVLLFPGWALGMDEICKAHKPDPEINEHAKDLAIQLLDGQPSFRTNFDEYVKELRTRPDGAKAEGDLVVDLYCKAPKEVALTIDRASGGLAYTIDTWRANVNQSVASLGLNANPEAIIPGIEQNLNSVPDDDILVVIADFNRDAKKAAVPFLATRGDDGKIRIFRNH
jgi:hypothetical protein